MTSSNGSTMDSSGTYIPKNTHRRNGKGCCNKGNWSGLNIAAMVIGFVIFWPLGLVILYWNIRGRNVKDLPAAIQSRWSSMVNGTFGSRSSHEGK